MVKLIKICMTHFQSLSQIKRQISCMAYIIGFDPFSKHDFKIILCFKMPHFRYSIAWVKATRKFLVMTLPLSWSALLSMRLNKLRIFPIKFFKQLKNIFLIFVPPHICEAESQPPPCLISYGSFDLQNIFIPSCGQFIGQRPKKFHNCHM